MSSKNLGLIYESFSLDISCNFASSSTGRTKVKQSLSLKKVVSSFLILFLRCACSFVPFWGLNAFYKYSWGLIGNPFSSTSLRAKSLTSQSRLGKHYIIVCLSLSSPFCNNLLKLIIKLKLWTAFSSILPTLLYIKKDERSIAIRNILVSVCYPY